MEEKISKIATSIVGGSFFISAFFLFLIFGSGALANEGIGLLFNPFVVKILIIVVLYATSIYFLATLPNKSRKRRLFSWCYSIVFHSVFLLYLWLMSGKENGVLVIGMAECLVLLFSIIGLLALYLKKEKY
ncbi:hypothetical protein [Desulfopila sp. IMCC35008]|uniref:hypothetical protein n=1 Tax=Desulfopila sp. IMCC35008 TaxID=2653858 RepID=UPI0013D554E3|nr:hypothetical protein [Desulfopila sp. IMCC35008]